MRTWGHPISSLPFDTASVHDSRSDELEELAAAFALDSIEGDEARDFRSHIGGCDVCEQLVAEFRAAAELIPLSLEPEPGSADLKRRILDVAASEERERASSARRRPSSDRAGPRLPMWVVPSFAVLSLALVAVVAWSLTLALRDDDTRGLVTARLFGTEAAPDASGLVVRQEGAEEALLVVRNLPILPSEQEYQIWSIGEAGPVGVGTFRLVDPAEQVIDVSADFGDEDVIGVSIEPRGGSTAPTGAIVLLSVE